MNRDRASTVGCSECLFKEILNTNSECPLVRSYWPTNLRGPIGGLRGDCSEKRCMGKRRLCPRCGHSKVNELRYCSERRLSRSPPQHCETKLKGSYEPSVTTVGNSRSHVAALLRSCAGKHTRISVVQMTLPSSRPTMHACNGPSVDLSRMRDLVLKELTGGAA